ncbi:MAG: hypothetical protein J6P21_01025 [Clostridia bacterium]|nr:hypothetical protein [Clostridia bacterium]
MSNFGKNKIALALACASILSGKASAVNTNGVRNSQVSGSARGGFNTSSIGNNLGKYIPWAGFGVGGAGLGTFLGWLLFHGKQNKQEVDVLRQKYEAGKQLFIDYFKSEKIGVFHFYFSGLREHSINYDDFVKFLCPELKDNKAVEFKEKRAELRKLYWNFVNMYEETKVKELWDIANKHKIAFDNGEDVDGYDNNGWKYNIAVEPSDTEKGKISVRIVYWDSNNSKEGDDLTDQFNIENPDNDEKKNKKDFYDEVVAWANKDEVLKAILLGDENEDEKK